MKVVGTVGLQNRLAHSYGFGASSKVGKPCRSVVQVRKKAEGKYSLIVSTKKELTACEYDLRAVQNLHRKFAGDGIATIEIGQPPMDIMLRNCNPQELTDFLNYVQDLRNGKTVERLDPPGPVNSPGTSNAASAGDGMEKPGTLRRAAVAVKRPRSPELSKTVAKSLKKCLQTNNGRLVNVKTRANYPSSFSSQTEEVKILGIGLKKVDQRWLQLKNLVKLEIGGNPLKNVNSLQRMNCTLRTLILTGTEIKSLNDNFFSSPALRYLTHLDLSHNLLTRLPVTISDLMVLRTADFSNNKIVYLPYNLMDLKNLRTLSLAQNELTFIPQTLTYLQLNRLDVSYNNANLQGENEEKEVTFDLVGYNEFPTLFEMAAEKAMNMLRKKGWWDGRHDFSGLPDIIKQYFRAGKYCCDCGKLALKYKIIQKRCSSSSLCSGRMSGCLFSPAGAVINVKAIKCYDCDDHDRKMFRSALVHQQILGRVRDLERQDPF